MSWEGHLREDLESLWPWQEWRLDGGRVGLQRAGREVGGVCW